MDTSDLDLAGYLRRIGHAAPCRPDRATLAALVAAQVAAIAFENIDVLAGRVPSLELGDVQRKLLHGGRGGYCYEQNSLLLAVLQAIGFEATPLEARVRLGVPADVVTGRTHLAVKVVLDGEALLADAGFGGHGPMGPVPFDGSPRRGPDGQVHRLVPHGLDLALQVQAAEGWNDCYHVGPETPRRIDLAMGNWYVATSPTAMLGHNLLVARAVDAGRLTLFNRVLTFRRPATGTFDERTVARPDIGGVLRERFGLAVAPADLARVLERLPD